mmetsp:Transcript_33535/g.88062  ORF Transcript_33535/g.88062 Transcript_33535/m.88062 type:complete len:263 (-) Transcript_33535:1536-2324(-)
MLRRGSVGGIALGDSGAGAPPPLLGILSRRLGMDTLSADRGFTCLRRFPGSVRPDRVPSPLGKVWDGSGFLPRERSPGAAGVGRGTDPARLRLRPTSSDGSAHRRSIIVQSNRVPSWPYMSCSACDACRHFSHSPHCSHRSAPVASLSKERTMSTMLFSQMVRSSFATVTASTSWRCGSKITDPFVNSVSDVKGSSSSLRMSWFAPTVTSVNSSGMPVFFKMAAIVKTSLSVWKGFVCALPRSSTEQLLTSSSSTVSEMNLP